MSETYSEEEQQKAARDLYERAWGREDSRYRPKPENWCARVLAGNMPVLTNAQTLDLQCALNRLQAPAEARTTEWRVEMFTLNKWHFCTSYDAAREDAAWSYLDDCTRNYASTFRLLRIATTETVVATRARKEGQ